MLHDFIFQNRDRIIASARTRVRERSAPDAGEPRLEHGIPTFLTQLADALAEVTSAGTAERVSAHDATERIGASAALHGHELLKNGFTLAQVVHGYGDVCQVVTELAAGTDATISAEEFHVFNRCLDDAIAGAVTAYGRERERALASHGIERSGMLVHELRNLVNSAVLSFDVLKKGRVGLGGSTAAIHARSLAGLRALVERSVAQVRLEAGEPEIERISVFSLVRDVEVSAALQADAQGLDFTAAGVDPALSVDADPQLLSSALSNLLQNAFKFTRAGGRVTLGVRASPERVFIDVSDECGGLPDGKAAELFRPFAQASADRSGLGLGLPIALSAARANGGDLYVRDIPGKGCVFTIELPRRPPRSI